jgi:hypothetical protein
MYDGRCNAIRTREWEIIEGWAHVKLNMGHEQATNILLRELCEANVILIRIECE